MDEIFAASSDDVKAGPYASVEDARSKVVKDLKLKPGDKFMMGEIMPYMPGLCAHDVLEDIVDEAHATVGCVADDWLNDVPEKRVAELARGLNKILMRWIFKYGYIPDFGAMENQIEYRVKEDLSVEEIPLTNLVNLGHAKHDHTKN